MPMFGTEIMRYLGPLGSLLSVRDNGETYVKSVDNRSWRLRSRKKSDIPMEQWLAAVEKRRADIQAREPWRLDVRELPRLSQLEEWVSDGMCETIDGHYPVEIDGHGPNGAPSWVMALGYV